VEFLSNHYLTNQGNRTDRFTVATNMQEEKMANELTNLLAELKEQEALAFVDKQLADGQDALQLLGDARDGLKIVGNKFAEGTYFIPDLIYSGEILKQIAEKLKPHFKADAAGEKKAGKKVIIGTVEGDIHDIGKDMVVFMLETAGYDVIDLGIDVPIQKFVDALQESGAEVVGLSGFLTLAFDSMKFTIEAIQNAGLRDKVKIMIGGGQIDDEVCTYTGADAYGVDANAAIELTRGWIGE
jgi:methanogenic corrinoid protein MtbC1